MSEGWISLHRKMIDWEWYDHIPTKVLFLHCLLKANHKDKTWRGITIKRGQFLTSLGNLSDETGLTIQNVRTAIRNLESTCELTRKPTNKNTIISIANYEKYQEANKQTTIKQQTTNKQLTTTNNDNNGNNIYKEIWNEAFAFTPIPKIKEVTPSRENKLLLRFDSLEKFKECISIIKKSPYLMGQNDRNWKVTFDWILEPKNLTKVLEGNYVREETRGMGEWKTVR